MLVFGVWETGYIFPALGVFLGRRPHVLPFHNLFTNTKDFHTMVTSSPSISRV